MAVAAQSASPANPDQALSLRAIPWSHPPRLKWPVATELALSRIQSAQHSPHSSLYREVFRGAPVPGKDRERAKRSDGGTNCLSLLAAIVGSADIASGYVAIPIGERRWQRKTYYDLDGLAFGPQVPDERSFRRTERAAAQLSALGLVRCVAWHVRDRRDGSIRSIPGAKFVTEKCWKLLGAWAAVRAERRRRTQEKGQAKAAELAKLVAPGARRPSEPPTDDIPWSPEADAARAAAARTMPAKPPDPPPPAERRRGEPTLASDAAIAAIRALLDD